MEIFGNTPLFYILCCCGVKTSCGCHSVLAQPQITLQPTLRHLLPPITPPAAVSAFRSNITAPSACV